MQLFKRLGIGSVVLLLMLCKAAFAENSTRFVDGLSFGGYYSAGIILPRTLPSEAAINEISLITRWENDNRFKFFSELELQKPLNGNHHDGLNTDGSLIELERLYVDYNYSDKVNLRIGRFLSPVGRWNPLHAPPLVWTSSRPLATSRLFPTSTNGVMVFGAVPLSNSAFEYSFFIEGLQDQTENRDELKFRDVKGARFTFGESFNLGLNLLEFTEKAPTSRHYEMLGLDFITNFHKIEILGEGYQRWKSDNSDGGSGAYLQTAVPLPILNNWYGIARIETLHRPDEGYSERWVLGATWHIKPTQLLKLEFTGGSADQPESPRGFLSSFTVLF
ncbi:MAG: hypothetical protein H0W85_10625 [Methylotenera sp.]|nr:hypothetical protein [Methylotenera sp.]